MEESELAELLKLCRMTAKMSQELLADTLHRERSFISKVESGALIPNGIIIKKIGIATGCSDLIAAFFLKKDILVEYYKLKMQLAEVRSCLEMSSIIA